MGPESQPVLMIYSQNLPGFRDKVDEKTDPHYTGSGPAAAQNESALHVFDADGKNWNSKRQGN